MQPKEPMPLSVSRRQLLIAGGGLVVASAIPTSQLWAQEKNEEEKDLIFRTDDPRNGEPKLNDLVHSWITPTKHFYVRSHAPNPSIDPQQFQLKIEGKVRKPFTISLAGLMKFKQHTVTATLTCAGNRRAEFNREGKVGGVQWGAGAIGNAIWRGPSLADVLRSAGVTESAKHVWFEGLDQIERSDGVIPFGASIPIEKAMQNKNLPGALLAHQMNGAPLPADHGFPLRTVVPGYIGARSVKWLGKIIVSDRPSTNHYVATAYKIVKKTDAIDWREAGPIYRFPINAVTCTPAQKSQVAVGNIELTGYVLPSGDSGATVERVELSNDGGRTWVAAELGNDESPYCWRLWKGQLSVNADTKALMVRARDSAGNFMPGRVPWNAKGYLQNSWYRTRVEVQ
ncbi:MAG: molybdopterin-dependent oxidoreductase [Planctomycetota bacterium]